jgi:hypothetical protein
VIDGEEEEEEEGGERRSFTLTLNINDMAQCIVGK